ncbi:MAG: hypothetical protein IJ593_11510 [Lachnospiraceae bacterium]|nr:hypothetical protein [Lachnospiraceae bacterium]
MRIEINKNGYDLVEEYKSDKGHEKHIWHFDKKGIYINKTKETIKYELRNKK